MDVEQALDEFETKWHGAAPPDVANILQAVRETALDEAQQRELVNEILMIDLWHRWRRAMTGDEEVATPAAAETSAREAASRRLPECPLLSDYVQAFPELIRGNDDFSVELIGEEYRARRRWAAPPSHAEYLARYRRRAAEVEQVLQRVDRELPVRDAAAPSTARNLSGTETTSREGVAREGKPSIQFTPKRIGKYLVLEALDQGGQARIYRAVHPQLRQTVAIKLGHLLPHDNRDAREMLIAEARLLAQLDHPHLVRVHDLDFHKNRPFIVMDYIRGRNLQQARHEDNTSPRQAAEFVARIASALAAIHAQGVTHRDVKPGNILLDENGQPRLIDFGLARQRTAWTTLAEPQENLTGTLLYMAPEQAAGDAQRVGPQTDLFGLGGVLFFLLSGSSPIQAGTFNEVLDRVRGGQIEWEALARSGAPAALVEVCHKALAVNVEDRYENAAAMEADLQRWLNRRQRWKWRFSLVAVLLACLLAIAAAWAWSRTTPEETPQPSSVSPRQTAAHELLERAPRQDFGLEFDVAGHESGESSLALEDGQRVALRLKSEVDCYVGVWYVDAAGDVTQLYPNQREQDHFLAAGVTQMVPNSEEYAIRVHAAEGAEYFYAAATTHSWPGDAGVELGPAVVFASQEELKAWSDQARSVSVVDENSPRVAEEVIQIHVLPVD